MCVLSHQPGATRQHGKYRFRPYLSCSSGRRFHQISLLPSINPPCFVQGRSFINFRRKRHFLESMGTLVSLPFIAESFANKKRSTHLSWEELDLNQQNPKVPDLQSGPLPITVYLPSTGMRPLATSLSCICFTLSGLQPFTGNSFIQLPRKTGRTISSHPQAFPLALSVHMQNCHWCFRENLSKVFTRIALTVPLLFITDCHILELTIQVTRLPTINQPLQTGSNQSICCMVQSSQSCQPDSNR